MWTRFIFVLFLLSSTSTGYGKVLTVKVSAPGTLEQMVESHRLDTCTSLTVEGKLNSADIRTLRRLAGHAEDGKATGQLRTLNLSKVKFVTDKTPFLELNVAEEQLAGVITPDYVHSYTPRLNTSWSESSPGSGDISSFTGSSTYKKVERYKPIYYLSHTLQCSLMVSCQVKMKNDRFTYMRSESQFNTSDGLSDSLWQVLCKKGLDKFSGHRIEKRTDGYYLTAMSKRKQFSPITFYGCPQLRSVTLPKDIMFGPHIYDEGNCISYVIGKELFLWDRKEPSFSLCNKDTQGTASNIRHNIRSEEEYV